MKQIDDHRHRKGSLIQGVKVTMAAALALATIVGLYHAFNMYIDYRIEKKISAPDFLKSLSQTVRPSVVFDQDGSILADMGAMSYIDNIDVVLTDGRPTRLVLSPRVFLVVAPLLESLDGDFTVVVHKGKKYDWIYELKGVATLLLEESGEISNHRFRIEILR